MEIREIDIRQHVAALPPELRVTLVYAWKHGHAAPQDALQQAGEFLVSVGRLVPAPAPSPMPTPTPDTARDAMAGADAEGRDSDSDSDIADVRNAILASIPESRSAEPSTSAIPATPPPAPATPPVLIGPAREGQRWGLTPLW